MHRNGVKTGCVPRESDEVQEDEAMDCVPEMNTIDHYIGMHPIERGARFAFAASSYLFARSALSSPPSSFAAGPAAVPKPPRPARAGAGATTPRDGLAR
jgi:hypothetical protein